MMNKANHVVDDNVFHITVDDHVHRMIHLEKVENIPKNIHYKRDLCLISNLLDKQNNFYDNDHQGLEYTYLQ